MDAEVDDSLLIAESRSSGDKTSEEDDASAQLTVFYTDRLPVPYKLHQGVNVVGRQSSFAQRDAVRLHQWSIDYDGMNVHGIFLESSSVSSAHAVILVEAGAERCLVKDLKSRNKTFLKRGGKHVALEPGKQEPLESGDVLTFGALKCRVTYGGPEGGGVASVFGGGIGLRPIAMRNSSRALSIGQRSALPPLGPGRPGSLDKCPSLQAAPSKAAKEWFQHPARSSSSGGGPTSQPSPFANEPRGRGWQEEESPAGASDIPSKASFGFAPTIHEAEEHTSSDAEPETPRIDRPAMLSSPKLQPRQTPFASGINNSLEGAEPTSMDTGTHLASNDSQDDYRDAKGDIPQRSSVEMGAETLTQLKSESPPKAAGLPPRVPLRASPPGTPETEELVHSAASSPGRSSEGSGRGLSPIRTSDAQAAAALASGRPARPRQKSPTIKRSRSGRMAGQNKDAPRSKSPRLQRGFYVGEAPTAGGGGGSGGNGGSAIKMDEIRDAVRDIWTDM